MWKLVRRQVEIHTNCETELFQTAILFLLIPFLANTEILLDPIEIENSVKSTLKLHLKIEIVCFTNCFRSNLHFCNMFR